MSINRTLPEKNIGSKTSIGRVDEIDFICGKWYYSIVDHGHAVGYFRYEHLTFIC
jgi:hypothetical protein